MSFNVSTVAKGSPITPKPCVGGVCGDCKAHESTARMAGHAFEPRYDPIANVFGNSCICASPAFACDVDACDM